MPVLTLEAARPGRDIPYRSLRQIETRGSGESSRGLEHSRTLPRLRSIGSTRSVLECASPLAFSQLRLLLRWLRSRRPLALEEIVNFCRAKQEQRGWDQGG